MSTRHLTIMVTCVAIAGSGASGCVGGDASETTPPVMSAPVVQLGAPGEAPQVLTADEIASLPTTPPPTDGDVTFVTSMIHHHQQALEMIALVDARSDSDAIALMTERMRVGQLDEIAQMESWLTTHGHPLPDHAGGHGSTVMPGMLTDAEMAALEAAAGEAFDILFLTSMMRHHEGARIMVQALYDAGDGQEPALFQLAEGVSIDQAIEIARMATLLADLVAA